MNWIVVLTPIILGALIWLMTKIEDSEILK